MLLEETRQLAEMREELSFYTNQCLDEVKRVARDNVKVFKDHFCTQAQLQCTYINQFHSVWADFMKYFVIGHQTSTVEEVKAKTRVVGTVFEREPEPVSEPVIESMPETVPTQAQS